MKNKLLCLLLGHVVHTYNKGRPDNPEQAWGCLVCGKELLGEEKISSFFEYIKYVKEKREKKLEKVKDSENLPF